MRVISGMDAAVVTGAVRDRISVIPTKGSEMKALLMALLGFAVLSLSACNTVEGAGKDVKATGQAVENAAKDAKPK